MSGRIQKQGLSPSVSRFLVFSSIIILPILWDAFFFERNSDWRTFPILIFYIFFVIRYKVTAKTTFLICLILFLFMYIHYIFSPPEVFNSQFPIVPFGEKMARWLYLFLVIGAMQRWRE